MRLLSREGMRDVDIGICWDAGYIGICGIGGEDGGICGDMWDGPPPRNRPGRAAVFGPAPPIHEERETGTANDLQAKKRVLILYLTCWLSMI